MLSLLKFIGALKRVSSAKNSPRKISRTGGFGGGGGGEKKKNPPKDQGGQADQNSGMLIQLSITDRKCRADVGSAKHLAITAEKNQRGFRDDDLGLTLLPITFVSQIVGQAEMHSDSGSHTRQTIRVKIVRELAE